MALRIAVRNEDLTMTRFALSPLWELSHALRLLAGDPLQRDEPVLRPWLVRARDRYLALVRETDLEVILALHPPGWGADFLAPVPAGLYTTIDDLLDQVRSTPPDQAHREVAEALRRQPQVDPRSSGYWPATRWPSAPPTSWPPPGRRCSNRNGTRCEPSWNATSCTAPGNSPPGAGPPR